jgi:hypothetical protein
VVGEKRVPFAIRALRDRKEITTVKIVELAPISAEGTWFVAPDNSEFWAKCDNMREPKIKVRIQPNYSASARLGGERGRVMFYAVIESDRSVSHLVLIHKATPTLEAAEAIRQWRFAPAVCGATPVPVETSIGVDFCVER